MESSHSRARLFAVSLLLFTLNQLLQWLAMTHAGKDWLDFCHSDCNWYYTVMDGYAHAPSGHEKRDAANWAFFPLFPLIASAVEMATGWTKTLALVVTAKLLFLAAIYTYIRFATIWNPAINPWLAGIALALNPYSLYANTGYSEPLFLLLSSLAFLLLRKGEPIRAGVVGALLSASRPVGVVFVLPYLVNAYRRWRQPPGRRCDIALGLMLIPLGLAAFMLFLYGRTGDALAFSHIQVAWNRIPQNPWHYRNDLNLYFSASLLFAAGAILWLLIKRHLDLALFTLVATWIPLMTGIWAMPRYIWWQLPVLLVLTQLISYKKLWLLYLPLAIGGLIKVHLNWLDGKAWLQ